MNVDAYIWGVHVSEHFHGQVNDDEKRDDKKILLSLPMESFNFIFLINTKSNLNQLKSFNNVVSVFYIKNTYLVRTDLTKGIIIFY